MAEPKAITLRYNSQNVLALREGLWYESGGTNCAGCSNDALSKSDPPIINVAKVKVKVHFTYSIKHTKRAGDGWVEVNDGIAYKLTTSGYNWSEVPNPIGSDQMKVWFPQIENEICLSAYSQLYQAIKKQRDSLINKSITAAMHRGDGDSSNLPFCSQAFINKFKGLSTYSEWTGNGVTKDFDVDINVIVSIQPRNFHICSKQESNATSKEKDKSSLWCQTWNGEIPDDGGYYISVDDAIENSTNFQDYIPTTNYGKLGNGPIMTANHLKSQIEPGIQNAIVNSVANNGEAIEYQYVWPAGASATVPGVGKFIIRGLTPRVGVSWSAKLGTDESGGLVVSEQVFDFEIGSPALILALCQFLVNLFTDIPKELKEIAKEIDKTPNVIGTGTTPNTADGTLGNSIPKLGESSDTPTHRGVSSEPGSRNLGNQQGRAIVVEQSEIPAAPVPPLLPKGR